MRWQCGTGQTWCTPFIHPSHKCQRERCTTIVWPGYIRYLRPVVCQAHSLTRADSSARARRVPCTHHTNYFSDFGSLKDNWYCTFSNQITKVGFFLLPESFAIALTRPAFQTWPCALAFSVFNPFPLLLFLQEKHHVHRNGDRLLWHGQFQLRLLYARWRRLVQQHARFLPVILDRQARLPC